MIDFLLTTFLFSVGKRTPPNKIDYTFGAESRFKKYPNSRCWWCNFLAFNCISKNKTVCINKEVKM